MMHSQIEEEDTIARYVCNQLEPQERQAFEEHFLGCEECFESVQAAERFRVGIHDAVQRGLLNAKAKGAFATSGNWFVWAFAATACAAVTLAVFTGLMYFGQIRGLREELRHSTSQLQAEQQLVSGLQQKATVEQPEANVPVAMLQASRADEPATLVIPANANHVVLWIELGPSRFRDFRLEVFSSERRLVTDVDHLTRGPYGALAASIPTNRLPAGDFRIRLTGQDPPPTRLAGEYHLNIRRP